jgi:uncharacterized repeat protein (TIGR03803 family)
VGLTGALFFAHQAFMAWLSFLRVAADTTGTETVLYTFTGGITDGAYPYAGLVRDKKGTLYGTTEGGGASSVGTVFKVTP